ncbi:MAG: nucleoside hydrolase [Cytophagales bacterium]|nr:MAG: nucleoside hydrolase [Cytophagales bacterium]
MEKLAIIFDMETNDPDDYLTLLMLLGHRKVDLKAVSITPGSAYQVGLVRRTLSLFGKNIPVGAFDITHPKTCLSPWHEEVYGKVEPSDDAEEGAKVLAKYCNENTLLVTGAPLKNVGKALTIPHFQLGTLVAQGGFAGEGVVPEEKQLPQFKGKLTCPTFNLNGDVPSALKTLEAENIKKRYFVSKNVCHSVFYDATIHAEVKAKKEYSLALSLIFKGMDRYLQKKPEGKKLHDPLAACCAIEPNIGTWEEVSLFRQKGEWGAKIDKNTNTWIITDYNRALFLETFTDLA